MQRSSSDIDDIFTKKTLVQNVMKPNWDEVIKIYRERPKAYKARITKSGDTALHVAVSDGQEDIVEQLVELISLRGQPQDKEALEIKNVRGNTPLHSAAILGNARMCDRIATVDPSLVGARNNDSETPLFLAAFYGQTDAFLCLHAICGTEQGYSYCRRSDGETILHCAISRNYFDLAFQIIHLYPDMANSVSEQGLSPLHLLASKPSAFRSGIHLGRFNKIIYHMLYNEVRPHTYHCVEGIFVDELKAVQSDFRLPKKAKYPDNYETCVQFFKLPRKVVHEVGKCFYFAKHDTSEQIVLGREVAHVESQQSDVEKAQGYQSINKAQGHQLFPSNYGTCFEFVKLISKTMQTILRFGSTETKEIQEMKEKHTWSVQVMNELLRCASLYEYEDDGRNPQPTASSLTAEETKPYAIFDGGDVTFETDAIFMENNQSVIQHTEVVETNQQDQNKAKNDKNNNGEGEKGKTPKMSKWETPILTAAKNGITEMVEKILELFPVAIHDVNVEKKNIVLFAVENRQPDVYRLLLKRNIMKDSIFREVDDKGNSALHLAATLGDYKPWLISGAALQMQWEIKWYEFVRDSMTLNFFVRYNNEGKTPEDVFIETHKDLVKSGGEWLTSTSQTCSGVAGLVTTFAFATSTNVPGGLNQDTGKPILLNQPGFKIFAISSLVSLCFSVISGATFLAFLASKYEERDFRKDLPRKLLVGLTSLFVSIVSMLICFFTGHFFVYNDELKNAAFMVYALTCFPVACFAILRFPLYFHLIEATFNKVPQGSYKVVAP